MSESQFEKIMRKTGRKPISCKCEQCKSQCKTNPCLGTPEDIIKLIKAGYADRLAATTWFAGMIMKVCDHPIKMIQPLYDTEKKACTFFTNGLCELHDAGLKPTEGKLSSHLIQEDNFNPKKSIAYNVAKTWEDISKDELNEMLANFAP